MAEINVLAYMLTIKLGTKLIKGLETTGVKFKPNFETSLLKEDAGNEVDEFIDYDADLSIAGKTIKMDSGDSSTVEDFETLREASTVGSEITFVYGRMVSGSRIFSGTGTIRDWGEDAGSEKKLASWSGSIKLKKGSGSFSAFSA
jgi:hypothetical protein